MANELSLTLGWKYSKSNRIRTVAPVTTKHDITAATVVGQVQDIGFSAHEALVLGDVVTPGFAWFHNLDGTNFVEIGIDVGATFYPFIKLLAGQNTCCWMGTAAPYAKADTAAVELDYVLHGV